MLKLVTDRVLLCKPLQRSNLECCKNRPSNESQSNDSLSFFRISYVHPWRDGRVLFPLSKTRSAQDAQRKRRVETWSILFRKFPAFCWTTCYKQEKQRTFVPFRVALVFRDADFINKNSVKDIFQIILVWTVHRVFDLCSYVCRLCLVWVHWLPFLSDRKIQSGTLWTVMSEMSPRSIIVVWYFSVRVRAMVMNLTDETTWGSNAVSVQFLFFHPFFLNFEALDSHWAFPLYSKILLTIKKLTGKAQTCLFMSSLWVRKSSDCCTWAPFLFNSKLNRHVRWDYSDGVSVASAVIRWKFRRFAFINLGEFYSRETAFIKT